MKTIQKLAKLADIDLDRDVIIHDKNIYKRVIKDGSLGLGETYMEGLWDTEKLDEIFYKIGKAKIESSDISWRDKINLIYEWIKSTIFSYNPQSVDKSKEVALQHYNLNNELYEKMLDPLMIYSCGYWKNANNLEEAQINKCDLIARKLYLKPGMRVLDIGCGFGSLSKFLHDNYGVKVVGITNSEEQYGYAIKNRGNRNIKYILDDYRNIGKYNKGKLYDRIVSVGMFEHVGTDNYKKFFEIADKNLKLDGIFLLHTIGGNKETKRGDRWMTKYIFPNSVLPTLKQIIETSRDKFIIEDVHNFGPHYDKTLQAWWHNFDKTFKGKRNGTFYRMWKYYLLSSAGTFRARSIQLYQIILTKKTNRNEEYQSVR